MNGSFRGLSVCDASSVERWQKAGTIAPQLRKAQSLGWLHVNVAISDVTAWGSSITGAFFHEHQTAMSRLTRTDTGGTGRGVAAGGAGPYRRSATADPACPVPTALCGESGPGQAMRKTPTDRLPIKQGREGFCSRLGGLARMLAAGRKSAQIADWRTGFPKGQWPLLVQRKAGGFERGDSVLYPLQPRHNEIMP